MKMTLKRGKKYKIELQAKNNAWLISVYYFLFEEKIMFQSHKIKSYHRVLRKNKEDTCGASVFAPDYSATVLAAKMFTNFHKDSMYNRTCNPTLMSSSQVAKNAKGTITTV